MLNKFRFLAQCTAVCAVATVSVTAATKPNVVILLADDLGYAEIGCYGGRVKTPALDGLAQGGMSLRRCGCLLALARCAFNRASSHSHRTV